MTAFLFDEDHPDLDTFFGPQCASFIINAIENTPSIPPLRLLRGSLLHHRYCYALSEVSLTSARGEPSDIRVSSSGQKFEPDMQHLLTIICDLAETMTACGSSILLDELQTILARKNVWVVVVQGLADDHRPVIEDALSHFGPFLGWVKVDWDNPIQMDLFGHSLFKNMFVDERGLCVKSEWPEGSEDREDEEATAAEYGSKSKPIMLDNLEFEEQAPKLISPNEPSERGSLSSRRISGDKTHHRAKIGTILTQDQIEAVGDFRTFSAKRPEDGIEFFVPEKKLTGYLLKLDHPDGAAKAKFFKDTLDITSADWRFLADQFCQAASKAELYRLNVKEYGVMHGALALITGRNDRQAVVETGWKLEETGPASFVTAYPGDETKMDVLEPVIGRVPNLQCLPPLRWEKIHEMAHRTGLQRGEGAIPTPMVLETYGTIWEGACGFGWAFLPDARHPFAKWALKNKVGYPTRPGINISSKLNTQSIEKNLAYAQGYVEVLKANGIEANAQSRLD